VSSELASKVNKERAVLITIPLLVLHLVLLSLQIEDRSGTLLFRTWMLTAQAPVVAFSSGCMRGIRYVWSTYVWTVGARKENRQLKETVRRLSLVNSSYEQIRQENTRLLRLLSMDEHVPYKTLGAHVVARTPGFLSNVIYLNRGSSDGVRTDMPVVSGDGIIGRTVLVSKYQSQVQLLTNPDANIGAMLERTRVLGVLRGTGDLLLNLDYVANSEQVDVGDVVLSSGLDGIYPKGLAIGKVVDSRKGKGIFRPIKIQPFMDFMRIEEVSIILGEPKPEPELRAQH
jgi:rod shape-determining protein MreC